MRTSSAQRALLALPQRARRGASRAARRPRRRRCGASARTRRRDCRARPRAGRPACRSARRPRPPQHAATRRSPRRRPSPSDAPRPRLALARPRPRRPLRPRPPSASSSTTRGATTCATSVVGLELARSTPVGQRQVGDAELVADLERRDVDLDRRRDVAGHGLDGEREERAARAMPPSLHARRPRRSRWSGISALTATSRRMRMKSTCTSSPRVGWRWIWRASVSGLVAVDARG